MMTSERRDKNIARSILIVSGGIVIYWLYEAIVWLVHWLSTAGLKAGVGVNFGEFCLDNLGIILVVYVIICLQIAGVVEFRQRRTFTEAFFLGVILTPILMPVYMRLKEKGFFKAKRRFE
jgi:hypothetical protein